MRLRHEAVGARGCVADVLPSWTNFAPRSRAATAISGRSRGGGVYG
jgi:hypothetical protein